MTKLVNVITQFFLKSDSQDLWYGKQVARHQRIAFHVLANNNFYFSSKIGFQF